MEYVTLNSSVRMPMLGYGVCARIRRMSTLIL